ncbi:MAG: Type fimbrial assembly protein PilC [Verrucomicrobiales bacterium]|nr:Type fimbrial assembly protein PilC [Verrucomicrobiales bacterium]
MSFIVTPGQLNQRAELYHQLGTMLTAGIPLIKALEMACNRSEVSGSRKVAMALIRDLESGLSFTESMGRSQGWLPEFDMALLSTGEKTGRLDTSFKLLAEYYSSRAKIIRDAITGSLITVATLHVFLFVFPLSFLISCAQGIINHEYSQCIPFVMEKLVVFGSIYGGIFFLIFACQGRRGEHWRRIIESITQRIPILRTAQKYLVLARLAAALEALISAGVSILTSWELAAAACGSVYLQRVVAGWKTEFERGVTPAELVSETNYFPQMFANFYHTGEQSGSLDDSLTRLKNYYQEEGFRLLRLFTRILNGVIYGLVALSVGIFVIRFWMQYYGALLGGL